MIIILFVLEAKHSKLKLTNDISYKHKVIIHKYLKNRIRDLTSVFMTAVAVCILFGGFILWPYS